MAVDEFGREIPAPQQPWRGDADYGRGGEHSNRRSSPRQAPRRPSSSSSRQSPRHAQHPSFQYVKEPLLCEYLWKKQQQDDEQKEEEEKSQEGESKESADNNEDTPYDLYRRKYCLNYVRAFFNQHLDDSWFRARYSPAVRQAWLDQEQARAVTEARAILTSIKQDATTFVAQAALSSGHKDPNQVVAIPKSHLFAWQQESSPQQALLVTEIPAAVTDNQLMIALQNLVQQQQDVDLQVYSSCQVVTGDNTKILQRQALVVGQAAVIQEILAAGNNKLEVDCSDPYGRLQYDADNRGGAPADGLAVPCRKARVVVSLASNILNLTTTLSAAVSVQARFTQDAASAQQMAVLLDEQRHVPVDCQWNTLQQALEATTTESDVLDVCIAYLRRVHLVSFYHSAHQPAECVADMFGSKQHAIHLRLASAEDVLASSSKSGLVETSTQEEAKDLLVQRLDESIAQALETFAAAPPTTTRPQQVAEIHQAEQDVRNDWLRNHSLIDTDNRARCSFHFCHKLFKDTSFLHKHLLKKHVEYLLAEQAASHDSYMMQAWDAATSRPVPDILVDCGTRFGWVAASVTGVPDCVDPEPGLWQREEERRERDMKARREETRQQALAAPPPPPPPTNNPRPSNYVDVDDMKEEKVELSFDNVDVPKKKKKKRKLL